MDELREKAYPCAHDMLIPWFDWLVAAWFAIYLSEYNYFAERVPLRSRVCGHSSADATPERRTTNDCDFGPK